MSLTRSLSRRALPLSPTAQHDPLCKYFLQVGGFGIDENNWTLKDDFGGRLEPQLEFLDDYD